MNKTICARCGGTICCMCEDWGIPATGHHYCDNCYAETKTLIDCSVRNYQNHFILKEFLCIECYKSFSKSASRVLIQKRKNFSLLN